MNSPIRLVRFSSSNKFIVCTKLGNYLLWRLAYGQIDTDAMLEANRLHYSIFSKGGI
jgi:hypothetical protein